MIRKNVGSMKTAKANTITSNIQQQPAVQERKAYFFQLKEGGDVFSSFGKRSDSPLSVAPEPPPFFSGAGIQAKPASKVSQHLSLQSSNSGIPQIQRGILDIFGGKCCNRSPDGAEWALLDDGSWHQLQSGDCTGTTQDCNGMTCGGGFYHVRNLETGTCSTPRVDDAVFTPRRWTPAEPNRSNAKSPVDCGAGSNYPPGFRYDGDSEPSEGEARCEPDRIAGAVNSDRIIRLAWTFDDGPHSVFSDEAAAAVGGFSGTTWFVVRRALEEQGQDGIRRLQRIQDQEGGEIGLHFERSWFPGQSGSFDNIDAAMAAVLDFKALLERNNIIVNFVRPHGGLISELTAYFVSLGISNSTDSNPPYIANKLARRAIGAHVRNAREPQNQQERSAYQIVERDVNKMREQFQSMQLHLWAGSNSGPEMNAQSWEAESGIHDTFVDTFNSLAQGRSFPRSLVILAHDTSEEYVNKVKEATQKAEEAASGNNIKVEYYTLSKLYHCLRGQPPEQVRPE